MVNSLLFINPHFDKAAYCSDGPPLVHHRHLHGPWSRRGNPHHQYLESDLSGAGPENLPTESFGPDVTVIINILCTYKRTDTHKTKYSMF